MLSEGATVYFGLLSTLHGQEFSSCCGLWLRMVATHVLSFCARRFALLVFRLQFRDV